MNEHGPITTLLFLLLGAGCSESAVSPDQGPYDWTMPDAAPDAQVDAGTDADVDAGGDPFDAGDIGESDVVFNELRGAGEDWIELYNAGSAAAELGDFLVADGDANGAPRLEEAMSIPEGTALVPGAYLFIVANLGNDAEGGWQTACLPGAPSPCLQTSWGISQEDGDVLTLLDADGVIVARVRYPGGLEDDESWARLPDGEGELARARPTPGQPNAAP